MTTLREYYLKFGVDENLLTQLNNELRIKSFTGLTNEVHDKRLASLNQAKSDIWNHGPSMSTDEINQELKNHHDDMSKWQRVRTPIYNIEGF